LAGKRYTGRQHLSNKARGSLRWTPADAVGIIYIKKAQYVLQSNKYKGKCLIFKRLPLAVSSWTVFCIDKLQNLTLTARKAMASTLFRFWLTLIVAAGFLEILDAAFDMRTIPQQGKLALFAFFLLAWGARKRWRAAQRGNN
jgi:hypothetical protein